MKKVMTLSMCLLVTLTSLASGLEHNMSSNFDDKEITLTLNNVKEGQNLSIKDNYGFVLYKKVFEKSGNANQKFDLSALPNGTYYFEHEKDYEIKVIPFHVKSGEVTYDTVNEKIIHKPVVRLTDNKVYLSKLELDKEDVAVSLYYADDYNEFKVVHTENFEDTANIQRVYSLSKKNSGNYKMIINANGREYIEYFSM
ncbi:hypothetical protein [Formosa agariphila]|nr:hypothetical protein [Formosa agariphila]